MEPSDIVWIKPLKKEGMLVNFSRDSHDGKEKCVVFVENDRVYIVDRDDITFVATLDESIEAEKEKRLSYA